MTTTYSAYAQRSGEWWAVDIPGVGGRAIFTQGRTLADAEEMAADAVASVLDVPIETVAVNLHVRAAEPVLAEVVNARRGREQASAHERAMLSRAARTLVGQGMSQRDAARLLGISHQRVSQLLKQHVAA